MTLYEKLQQANLPVITATEEGVVSMGVMTDEQETLLNEIVQDHFYTDEQRWDMIRSVRDDLLTQSDWVVIKAQELNESIPEIWATYRKTLRDIPQNYQAPEDVIFPEL